MGTLPLANPSLQQDPIGWICEYPLRPRLPLAFTHLEHSLLLLSAPRGRRGRVVARALSYERRGPAERSIDREVVEVVRTQTRGKVLRARNHPTSPSLSAPSGRRGGSNYPRSRSENPKAALAVFPRPSRGENAIFLQIGLLLRIARRQLEKPRRVAAEDVALGLSRRGTAGRRSCSAGPNPNADSRTNRGAASRP